MREREQILDLWQDMRSREQNGVLITVVKTLGSSYRRPGARLLLSEDVRRAGSISGGCLEEDVLRKAWWLTESGSVIRRYDTTPDGEIGPTGDETGGFGLGCNGIIYLLLDRVLANGGKTLALDTLSQVYATRQPGTLSHVLRPPDAVGTFAAESLGNSPEVFPETLLPPLRLLIFGAGDDASPLTLLARYLGWQVAVYDGRSHYARPDRFPQAQQVAVWNPGESLDCLQIDTRTVAVIMTHSYSQDLYFIRELAHRPLAYLGLLGPRNRSLQLLQDAGVGADNMPSLHGPVGLDIGADGPEQVALSIIAEIQAVINGRQGGSLRTRTGSIHSSDIDALSAQPFTPSIVCA